MNTLSMICVVTATLAASLATMAFTLRGKAHLNRLLALAALAYAWWTFWLAFVFPATVPEDFWLFLKLSFTGYLATQPLILATFIELVGKKGRKVWFFLFPTVLLSVLELFQVWTGSWLIADYHSSVWGNVGELTNNAFWLNLNLLKGGLTSVLILFFLFSAWKQARSKRFKSILRIFLLLALMSSLVFVFGVLVVWLAWGYPDPSFISGLLAVIGIFLLITRYEHLMLTGPSLQDPVFNSLRDLLILCNNKGEVIQVSARAAALLGTNEKDLTGKTVFEVLPTWTLLSSVWIDFENHASNPEQKTLQGYLGSSKYFLNLMPIQDKFLDFGMVLIRLVAAEKLEEAVQQYGISVRERDTLALLVDGYSTQEISQALFISPSTVKNHIHKLFEKTETNGRVELVRLILKGS